MTKRWASARAGWLLTGLAALASSTAAWGQARPTATKAIDISFFGAGTGTYTELDSGRNLGITAGADITLRELYFHVRPGLEFRGTYAVDQGSVDGQNSAMVGPRFSREFGRFSPYVDGFYGRGALSYPNGIVIGNYRYDRTTSNVFAGGGGVDLRVTRHFDAKADILFERWTTPVIPTGIIYPIPISLGVVYHLDFDRRSHKTKREKRKKGAPDQPTVAP